MNISPKMALFLAFANGFVLQLFPIPSYSKKFDVWQGKSYAVVIGINNYRDSESWHSLPTTENDVNGMTEYLKSQGFDVTVIQNSEATKENIEFYLEDKITRNQQENDRFLFYFSGHGFSKDIYITEKGKPDTLHFGYLVPYDAKGKFTSTMISMNKIKSTSEQLGGMKHQLYILDSCYGGLLAKKAATEFSQVNHSLPHFLDGIRDQRALEILTAGGSTERVGTNGLHGFSTFTFHLLKGLRDKEADTFKDNLITGNELIAYLKPAATTADQSPVGDVLPGHAQGDFFFVTPEYIPSKSNSNPSPSGTLKGLSYELDPATLNISVIDSETKKSIWGYIYLNDIKRGIAPKVLTNIEPKKYILRIENDGYETLIKSLDLAPNDNLKLPLELKRKM